MKSTLYVLSFVVLTSYGITGCKKGDHSHAGPGEPQDEYPYIRVLVADAASTEISQVDPLGGTVQQFTAPYPNATLYPTASRRFGAMLFGTHNQCTVFRLRFCLSRRSRRREGHRKNGGDDFSCTWARSFQIQG